MAAQRFGGVDGVVIGHGNQIHAAPLQRFIELSRLAIALPANPLENRHGAHTGVNRVDVQIALHAPL